MNFRIANFNVENLILPDIRYYDRMIFTQEDYDAKAHWIASVINRVKPDIIGVQELWTTEALEDVVSRSFHFANGAHIAAPADRRRRCPPPVRPGPACGPTPHDRPGRRRPAGRGRLHAAAATVSVPGPAALRVLATPLRA